MAKNKDNQKAKAIAEQKKEEAKINKNRSDVVKEANRVKARHPACHTYFNHAPAVSEEEAKAFNNTLAMHDGISNTRKRIANNARISKARNEARAKARGQSVRVNTNLDLIKYLTDTYNQSIGNGKAYVREYIDPNPSKFDPLESRLDFKGKVSFDYFLGIPIKRNGWKYNKSYNVITPAHTLISSREMYNKYVRPIENCDASKEDFEDEVTMYHGTPAVNLISILNTPFHRGPSGFLGAAIYITPDIAKCWTYNGDVAFSSQSDKPRRFILEVRCRLGIIANSADIAQNDLAKNTETVANIWKRMQHTAIYAGPDCKPSWAFGNLQYSEYAFYSSEQIILTAIHEFIKL